MFRLTLMIEAYDEQQNSLIIRYQEAIMQFQQELLSLEEIPMMYTRLIH